MSASHQFLLCGTASKGLSVGGRSAQTLLVLEHSLLTMATPLERLRNTCMQLPDVTEKISHGEPAWFAKKRLFAMFADEHHDNRVAFWCAAPEVAQEALIESDPTKYFRP